MESVVERRTSIADFKARISEYAAAVEGGASFTVTRYNKPVFRVVPVKEVGKEPCCKGMLSKYADIEKIPFEKGAWGRDVVRREADLA